MICTLTLNPSIDYAVRVPELQPEKLNRSTGEYVLPGGKGVNVSRVLGHLGCETTAMGFEAGFTGGELIRLLQADGCRTDFVHLPDGMTRINVKVSGQKHETEINGRGPEVSPQKLEELFLRLLALPAGTMLVLSGSVPPGVSRSVYAEIMQRLSGRGIRFVVDAERDLLREALSHHPFLVKPNQQELSEFFGEEVKNPEDAGRLAVRMREMGAENVLVSLGGDGAVLASPDHVCRADAPRGIVRNTIGAGDSMVAGFLAGWERYGGDAASAMRMGIAAGSASAFSDDLAAGDEIRALEALLPMPEMMR